MNVKTISPLQLHERVRSDQGIELMTGVPAGRHEADGRFTPGSVNALAEARLEAFANARKAFAERGTLAGRGDPS